MRREILEDNEVTINTDILYEPLFPIYHIYDDKISFVVSLEDDKHFEVIFKNEDLENALSRYKEAQQIYENKYKELGISSRK